MKKKLLFLLFLLTSIMSFSFQMTPISFEKRIDNGQGFREFYFPNPGTKTIRYRFDSLPGSSHRGDMSKWVEIYPKILTIKPEQTGVLKIFVESPKGTPEGEYGFFLDALPVEILDREEQSKDIKASSAVKIRASIELVGYVGDIQPELKVQNTKIFQKNGKANLNFVLKNLSKKRGIELTALVKGKNNQITRKDLGRIGKNGTLKVDILLDKMKTTDPYAVEFVETLSNKKVFEIKL